MSSNTSAMLGLHASRLAQLKKIAARRGLAAAEVIETFINREITEGRLEDATPGFEITSGDRGPTFGFGGVLLHDLSRPAAEDIAGALERPAGALMLIIEGASVEVARKGRGVTIQLHTSGALELHASTSVTPGLALDLARQLRMAARECQ